MRATTFKQILKEEIIPVVAIDENGIFFHSNKAFETAYGWSREELLGKVITTIMPPYMRDAHNLGFSRFLTTEISKIQGKPLPLPVYCRNGKIVEAEHYIVGEKLEGVWHFGATITPK